MQITITVHDCVTPISSTNPLMHGVCQVVFFSNDNVRSLLSQCLTCFILATSTINDVYEYVCPKRLYQWNIKK